MRLYLLTIFLFFSIASTQLTWKKCNLYTNEIKEIPAKTNENSYQPKNKIVEAECSIFKTPLFSGNQRNVSIHLKRKTSATSTNLLFLTGSELGESSSQLDSLMDTLSHSLNGKFDIYSIEHRGVGRSERLNCLQTQAETPGSEGERIQFFKLFQVELKSQKVNFQLVLKN
jgi:hypothetical protein